MKTEKNLRIIIDNECEVDPADNAKALRPALEKTYKKNAEDIVIEIANQHVNTLCKKLCYDNCHKLRCTLDETWNKSPSNSPLCDWGNGTYQWIVDELTGIQHQNDVQNRKVLFLENYFRKIITSIQFWERYKNWRFQRRIRVPDYIKVLDHDACKVFWGLYDQDSLENLAQRLVRTHDEIKELTDKIHSELRARKRSYVLEKNIEVSLDQIISESSKEDYLFQSNDISEEELELRENVLDAYNKLSWQEQYILDVMIVDNLSAFAVLKTLKEQSISFDSKIDPSELNIQHVYYFLRKTILKLKQKTNIH